jgi:uncharacterized membrane protein
MNGPDAAGQGEDPRGIPPRMPPLLRRAISRILVGGVLVSGALLVVGLFLLVRDHGGSPDLGPVALPLGGLAASFAMGDSNAVLWVGLIVLVLTPLARVAISVVGFARLRDNGYVAMTTFVLLILLLSAVIGVGL